MDKKQNLNSKNNIIYSNKIFDSSNEERPGFILKELEEKNSEGKANRVLAILLKYKIDGKEQEAIIGTLKNTIDRTEKAKIIIEHLTEQFHENFDGKPGFDSYYKLMQYKNKERVPFELTTEGISMLAVKDKSDVEITRTVADNGNGKMNKIFVDKDIKRMKEQKNIEILNYIKDKEEKRKWKERREKILNQFEKTDKEKRTKFIKGEKITEYITNLNEDSEENSNIKKDLVGNYLVEYFESGDSKKADVANGYAKMQEKGFAINVRVALEKQRDKCYNLIQTEESKMSEEKIDKITKLIDNINEYLNLFELIKENRNWNASFTYKVKKLNFADVKKMCALYDKDDEEILHYIDLKEKTLRDEKLNKSGKENEYMNSESMQNLDKFLVKSHVKDYTNPNPLYSAKNVVVKNGKYMIDKLYEHIQRELIDYNSDCLGVYNEYAKKSQGIVTYSVDKKTNVDDEKREISNTVKKLSEQIVEGEKTYPDFDDNGNR